MQIYSVAEVHIGKCWSYAFPIQNCLEVGDVSELLLSNFAFEYAIRNV
jgi:hypothetical protein